MSEKKKLINQDALDELLGRASDPEYLATLSDKELKKLHADAKQLWDFFRLMQLVTKELCNSVYGGFGTASLRYFFQAVAEDITGEGREHCKLMDRTANSYFSKVWPTDFKWHETLREKFPNIMKEGVVPKSIMKDIVNYADTDSNYVAFDYVFESIGIDPYAIDIKEAVDFIVFFMKTKMDPLYDMVLKNSISKRNGQSTMIFELELVGGFSIWAAKKKYALAKLWVDGKYVADKKSLKTTGIELAQKSSPLHVRKIIQTFVNTIFVRKGKIDSTLFFGMCKSVKDKLADCSPDDLSKTNNIQKYSDYIIDDKEKITYRPKTPAAVKGAARYNQMVYKLGLQATYPYIGDGMKGRLYYDTKGEPFTYPTEIDTCPPFAPQMSVATQLDKLIFSPVKRLVAGGLIDGDLKSMGSDKVQKGFSGIIGKMKLNSQK